MLNLKPGQKVLDVGCGIGGGDFYMAKVRPTACVESHERNQQDRDERRLVACCRVSEWKCWAWTCQRTW